MESTEGALDLNSATQAFAEMLTQEEQPQEPTEGEQPQADSPDEPQAQEEAQEEAKPQEEGGEKITIEIDGKMVELTPEQVAEAYKSGLRQQDYTKKTMQAAEERKAAEAEYQKAQSERMEYQQKISQFENLLNAQLQEQSQINWQQLINDDPVEYLRQQHLYTQRQAQLAQAQQERFRIEQLQAQEQQSAFNRYISEQQEQLLAKLPEWKDEGKAKAQKAEIKAYLSDLGFSNDEISQIADHRHVLLIRNAMQFDKLMKAAPDATKKVERTPLKVERPGVRNNGSPDARSKAMQRLSKTGSLDAATEVFKNLL